MARELILGEIAESAVVAVGGLGTGVARQMADAGHFGPLFDPAAVWIGRFDAEDHRQLAVPDYLARLGGRGDDAIPSAVRATRFLVEFVLQRLGRLDLLLDCSAVRRAVLG